MSTEWKRGIFPVESPETKPFWDACRRKELIVQRCRACGKHQWHYRAICCHCWSDDVEDHVSSGKGRISTFSVVHRNVTPGFREEVPYVTAMVEMEEGVLVMSNIVNAEPDDVTVGMPVQVTWVEASPEWTVYMFEPVTGASS
jgi:uncharacterized OB-fold protein